MDSSFKKEVGSLKDIKVKLTDQLNLKNKEIQEKDLKIKEFKINTNEINKKNSVSKVKCDECQQEFASFLKIRHHILEELSTLKNGMKEKEDGYTLSNSKLLAKVTKLNDALEEAEDTLSESSDEITKLVNKLR